MKSTLFPAAICCAVLVSSPPMARPEQFRYQKPSAAIQEVLDAPIPPAVTMAPGRKHLMVLQGTRFHTIADLSQPMLRLAGQRINPRNFSEHAQKYFVALSFVPVRGGEPVKVTLPSGARILTPKVTADGSSFAFLNLTENTVELWTGKVATGEAKRLAGLQINATAGQPLQWMDDGKHLLVQLVPGGRTQAPEAPAVPAGPIVQESAGKSGPVPTYQDMLSSPLDEALFEYYASSQAAIVAADGSGKPELVGKPAVLSMLTPSPDGRSVLATRIEKPYSYLHTYKNFPRSVEIWGRNGSVADVARLPLANRVPLGGVQPGPREFSWHPTEPGTLYWVEALDGGNPKEKVPHRDKLLRSKAPFKAPEEVASTVHRFTKLTWTASGKSALMKEVDRDRRWMDTRLLTPGSGEPKLIWSMSSQDKYKDPGNPLLTAPESDHGLIYQSGSSIFLKGAGATPKGDRPFLTKFDLETLKGETLFRSTDGAFEEIVDIADESGKTFVTSRESATEPPNYFLRNAADAAKAVQLTRFTDPTPQIRQIRKQLVTYKRADGVPLSFTLYLPPGYKQGTKLPALVWAYPLEYSDADTAGQVSGSTDKFTTFVGASHLYFLLNGYAILDNASLPVIGTPETMNNTYLEQITSGAKAAIDKASEMGVIDPQRVGVGGHSYGAFMTANLLAHSDLFRAGIARSGAYNRTLTPFGFQSERRTYWEAQETYLRMSPFMLANKVNEPILLIHGQADNNTGTYPIQSERMYQAIRGNGGIVRYVQLPFESHGYTGRESVQHTLWEMTNWFDIHVKGAEPKPATESSSSAER